MESTAFVQNRDVVVPGMVLAQGIDYLPSKGTYRKDDQIIANRLGLVQFDGKVIKTIPLAGRYLPKKDDIVIGKVIDVLLTGWRVELNCPYESVLTLKEASSDFIQRGADLTRYFNLNDWIICQVVQVTSQNLVDISVRGPGLRKLIGGTVLDINTQKVPRVIGKRGSMVGMIKRATDCNILVGQNGRVWLNGTPEMEVIAIQAITMIEENAHLSGLTERVKAFLSEKTGRAVEVVYDEAGDNGLGSGSEGGHSGGHGGGYRQGSRDGGQGGGFRREGGFRRDGPPREGGREGGGFRRQGFRDKLEGGSSAPRNPTDNAGQEGGSDNAPADDGQFVPQDDSEAGPRS